jgi:hypothetical protein
MTQGASQLPIVQFLNRLMNDHCFTPATLVNTLGYRRGQYAEKGLRRLNLWLETGEGHDRILEEIATIFPAYADGLEKAVAATKAIRNAKFEAAWLEQCKAEAGTFVPFLNAEGQDRIPNGICIFGMTGGHRRWTMTAIPRSILDLPLDNQLVALPGLMEAYRRQHNGAVPFFGKLTGFKFVRLLDYFRFDAEGNFVEHVDRPFRCSPCSVQLS